MSFLWISAQKDLRRFLRDPLSFVIWLAMPLVMLSVLALAFGRNDAIPQGRLLVADEDATTASRTIPAMLLLSLPRKMLTVEQVDRESGRRRAANGEVTALLVIPKGFGAAVLTHAPTKLELFTNPAERLLPAILEQTLALGIEAARSGPLSIADPKISVRTEITADPSETKRRSFASWFFPGMLLFSLLGIAQTMSQDLWKEHDFGALRRYLATPRDPAFLLGGKLIVVLIVDSVIAAFGIVCGIFLLGIPREGQLQGWCWMVMAGGGLYLMMAALQVISDNARSAHIVAMFVLFLFSMTGGSFFPLEFMPGWLAAIGRVTPNGWTLEGYKAIIDATLASRSMAIRWASLFVVSAVLFAFVRHRLRKGFA